MYKIVLVCPEYQQNIGYCARVAKNFGFDKLWIVNPKVRIGKEAFMYAKHAADVLRRARIVKNLRDAIVGCSLIVGTTAIKSTGRDILRKAISPSMLVSNLPQNLSRSRKLVAILFGREGTGLTKEELELCDIIVRIPTDDSYPTLNVSHAMAVILYELRKKELSTEETERIRKKKMNVEDKMDLFDEKERSILIHLFNNIVDKTKGIRSPSTVKLAFKRIIGRGIRSRTEGRALLQIIKSVHEEIKNKK